MPTEQNDDHTPEAVDRDAEEDGSMTQEEINQAVIGGGGEVAPELPAELEEMVDDAVSRMKRDLEAKDREAIAWLIGRMGQEMSEAEAGELHAVLIVDPDTGTRQVVGPYPDRLHAKIACVLLKARYEQDDPELGNLTFEPLIFFADPLTVP